MLKQKSWRVAGGPRRRTVAAVILVLGQITSQAWGGNIDLLISPDISIDFGGGEIADEFAVAFQGATPVSPVGPVRGADVSGLQMVGANAFLLSFDVTVSLPSGPTFEPRDILLYSGGLYSMFFDGSAEGLPPGSSIDGLAVDEVSNALYISLDTYADLDGLLVAPGDVVRVVSGNYEMAFDADVAGLPRSTNVDAVTLIGSTVLGLSFDVDTLILGNRVADEDLALWGLGGAWLQIIDSSAYGLPTHFDVDALDYPQAVSNEIFSDGFESGDTSAWSGN